MQLSCSHAGRHFYPRSPCGERPAMIWQMGRLWQFLSTLSLRRATWTGRDLVQRFLFLSTLSLRRATCSRRCRPAAPEFLSTLSLRRATHAVVAVQLFRRISIHALLAESDRTAAAGRPAFCNFYPRSPCGERRQMRGGAFPPSGISIHALLAESDTHSFSKIPAICRFLSTLSLRRATKCAAALFLPAAFLSTLSLRRATPRRRRCTAFQTYFYPRSPCGERHAGDDPPLCDRNFYPRSPCGERLIIGPVSFFNTQISIHALLAESDEKAHRQNRFPPRFLSTLSLRRATAKVHKTVGHFCAYETNFMGIASSC